MRRLHARVVDQPRGAAQVRDAALGRGAGPTRATVPSASGRPPGAGCCGDRVQPAPPPSPTTTTTTTPNDDEPHVVEPAPSKKPLDVLHQHRHGPLVAPEEEGHLPALQPPADVRDPHVGRGGPVRRAGDPRPERVTGCAHALCLHPHFVAAAAAPTHGQRPAATCTVAAAPNALISSAHPRVRARAGPQLADEPAAPTRANASAPIAGHRRDQRQQLHRRKRWVSGRL